MADAESLHFTRVVKFLTTVVPNLKRLDLWRNYTHRSIEIPKRRAKRAKLTHLDLSGISYPQRILFENLQKAVDLEMLESLSVPCISDFTFKWVETNLMSLPRLKNLKMEANPEDSMKYSCSSKLLRKNLGKLLMKVPSSKKLELFGEYHSFPHNCLEKHSTLESLTFDDNRCGFDPFFSTGIDLKLLERVLNHRKLTSLSIRVRQSKEAIRMWKMLQVSRVEPLILTLECRDWDFRKTQANSRALLKIAATDEALARSIYEVCGLEYLKFTSIAFKVDRLYGYEGSTVKAVVQELIGSYQVTRIEGRAHVVELPRKLQQIRDDDVKLDCGFMDIFRSIWPSQGGDWKDDWHSFPLVVDD